MCICKLLGEHILHQTCVFMIFVSKVTRVFEVGNMFSVTNVDLCPGTK